MKKKILFNAATITVGGGVQAVRTFIEFIRQENPQNVEFLFVLPHSVCSQLGDDVLAGLQVRRIDTSPASLIGGRTTRRQIRQWETAFRPDLVYSPGFPSYVAFRAPEAGRYTNPWEIFELKEARSLLTLSEKLRRAVKTAYRLHWAKKARFIETQTPQAATAIAARLGLPENHVFVSPNAVNPLFSDAAKLPRQATDGHEIFCFAAGHKHKNLAIIPKVAALLQRRLSGPFRFVLTLAEADWQPIRQAAAGLGVADKISNAGALKLEDSISHYRRAACLFLPTLAEVFSATHIEAMTMQLPVVTTDLPFSRSVCGDAAAYFAPVSADEAADRLTAVLQDADLREDMAARGAQQVAALPESAAKHRALLAWLVSLP